MKRLLQPFVLFATGFLVTGYAYLAWRLTSSAPQQLLLALPFVLIWMAPAVFWARDREKRGVVDDWLHRLSYLSMAWVSFVFVLAVVRDAVIVAGAVVPAGEGVRLLAEDAGVGLVFGGSIVALVLGAVAATRGPHVRHVNVPVDGLHPDLEGFRIVQISDLHVGLNIGRSYVERVVEKTLALDPDLIALTGDIVDAPVARIARDVAPLERLAETGRAYFVLGNHDCYSGAERWTRHFREMGMRVLENSHDVVTRGAARMIVGGVLDPAIRLQNPSLAPRPDLAMAGSPPAALRLLLAHNPRLAPLAAEAGWDVQLSGHTHAGQFFPWTLVIRFFHQHVAGLSREGRMRVYVSAGTGTWGPPVRVGTEPELTVLQLVRAGSAGPH